MASLSELKKHLRSIRMTGQLAGAMKTVSAAKLSRLNSALQRYADYEAVCRTIAERFGADLAQAIPCQAPDAPVCYVVLGSNRGLCGGFNTELYSFADRILASTERPFLLIPVGKTASAHFRDRGISAEREFILPDTAQYADCLPLLSYVISLYREGTVSTVVILYQQFKNTLTQIPSVFPFLPLEAGSAAAGSSDILYIPDRPTVLRSAAMTCMNAMFYARILESAAGAQAATLMAMRSAFENAEKSAAELEIHISRRRQSEVTSSVIETAGGSHVE